METDSHGRGIERTDDESISIDKVLEFLRRKQLNDVEDLLRKRLEGADTEPDDFTVDVRSKCSFTDKRYHQLVSPSPESLYKDLEVMMAYIEYCKDSHKQQMYFIVHLLMSFGFVNYLERFEEENARNFLLKAKQFDAMLDNLCDQLSHILLEDSARVKLFIEKSKNLVSTVTLTKQFHKYLLRLIDKNDLKGAKYIVDTFISVVEPPDAEDAARLARLGNPGILALKNLRKKKTVYYDPFERVSPQVSDNEEDSTMDDSKPKKKSAKKEPTIHRTHNLPNAPALDRIPFAEIRDSERADKLKACRDLSNQEKVGPNFPPSICFYSLLNSAQSVCCTSFSEDGRLLTAGLSDCGLRVWSITDQKILSLKPPDELSRIDIEGADDAHIQMWDDKRVSDGKALYGHRGPVYSVDFSPDKYYVLSSSEDGTVRLWSTHVWTNVVAYSAHVFPVWSCAFSPMGHYFASGGYDRLGRMWSTNHHKPLRIFAGHLSDVGCVCFHPNSNYVATGSADSTVRLWDCLDGRCIHNMSAHTTSVESMVFSPDGRYLATGDTHGLIFIWDILHGAALASLKGPKGMITSLSFSRDGSSLVAASLDKTIRLWDVDNLADKRNQVSWSNVPLQEPFASFETKRTPVTSVHFSRHNIVLASGPYSHSS